MSICEHGGLLGARCSDRSCIDSTALILFHHARFMSLWYNHALFFEICLRHCLSGSCVDLHRLWESMNTHGTAHHALWTSTGRSDTSLDRTTWTLCASMPGTLKTRSCSSAIPAGIVIAAATHLPPVRRIRTLTARIVSSEIAQDTAWTVANIVRRARESVSAKLAHAFPASYHCVGWTVYYSIWLRVFSAVYNQTTSTHLVRVP